jgi:hypothetical protein
MLNVFLFWLCLTEGKDKNSTVRAQRDWKSKNLFNSGFPTKTLHAFLCSLIRATYPTHLILLALITLTLWCGVQTVKFLRLSCFESQQMSLLCNICDSISVYLCCVTVSRLVGSNKVTTAWERAIPDAQKGLTAELCKCVTYVKVTYFVWQTSLSLLTSSFIVLPQRFQLNSPNARLSSARNWHAIFVR